MEALEAVLVDSLGDFLVDSLGGNLGSLGGMKETCNETYGPPIELSKCSGCPGHHYLNPKNNPSQGVPMTVLFGLPPHYNLNTCPHTFQQHEVLPCSH